MARVTGSTNTEEVSCILWLDTSLEPEMKISEMKVNAFVFLNTFLKQSLDNLLPSSVSPLSHFLFLPVILALKGLPTIW